MASVYLPEYDIDIDYSLKDGRVRELIVDGKTFYSEYKDIEISGWEDNLIEIIKANNLHIDKDDNGLHAFVLKYKEEGKL